MDGGMSCFPGLLSSYAFQVCFPGSTGRRCWGGPAVWGSFCWLLRNLRKWRRYWMLLTFPFVKVTFMSL
jgi:hypothetical protein